MLSKGCGKELVISGCNPGLTDSFSPSDEKIYSRVFRNTTPLPLVSFLIPPPSPGLLYSWAGPVWRLPHEWSPISVTQPLACPDVVDVPPTRPLYSS